MVVDLYDAMLQEVDFKKMKGGGASLGYIFFDSTLRNFSKERTCPHTIDWQHGIEHAARRQMHLCCTASNRIFRRYEGLTRFSWAGGTSIYSHLILDYPIVFLNMTNTSVVSLVNDVHTRPSRVF